MADTNKSLEDWLRGLNLPTAPGTPIDVVYGGAFSIKDYYMESGNPRQMRGASQLLLEAADEFEGVRFFECGAESFLIVPQGEGETFARRLERSLREKTLTAQAAAVWHETTVGALLDAGQFNDLWKDLNKAFGERRMLLFMQLQLPEDHFNYADKRYVDYIRPCQDGGRCSRCNYRETAYKAMMDPRYEGEFLECKLLCINRTLQRIRSDGESKTELAFLAPKSATSARAIPLPDFLLELLRDFKRTAKTDYVLTYKNSPIEPRTLQYRFKRILEAAEVKDVCWHTTRHTFATRALENGFDVKSLSEILGHSSATVTLNKYAHASTEHKRGCMNALSAVYSEA